MLLLPATTTLSPRRRLQPLPSLPDRLLRLKREQRTLLVPDLDDALTMAVATAEIQGWRLVGVAVQAEGRHPIYRCMLERLLREPAA